MNGLDDTEKLMKALDNEENIDLLNFTTEKINKMKEEILDELELFEHVKMDYMKKLKEYKYVDEMNDVRIGNFIRWIPIKEPENVYLSPGGIVCDLKITDSGLSILCKNFAGKHFQFKMEECIIFQKLTGQEKVLLSALDHLSK